MSDTCIVSFSSMGRENYPKAQLRLIRSCVENGWSGDYLMRSLDGWCDEYCGVKILTGMYPQQRKYPISHNHAEIPYGFKVDIIEEAWDKGYTQIVWADSTIILRKDPSPLLEYAKEHGVCAFENVGHPLKYYISDYAVERFGLIPEQELEHIKQIMGCVVIFDLSSAIGMGVFMEWQKASRDGLSFQDYPSSRPGFRAHRHDQAVLSLILHYFRVPLLDYGLLCYHPLEETKYPDAIFVNKGIQ